MRMRVYVPNHHDIRHPYVPCGLKKVLDLAGVVSYEEECSFASANSASKMGGAARFIR